MPIQHAFTSGRTAINMSDMLCSLTILQTWGQRGTRVQTTVTSATWSLTLVRTHTSSKCSRSPTHAETSQFSPALAYYEGVGKVLPKLLFPRLYRSVCRQHCCRYFQLLFNTSKFLMRIRVKHVDGSVASKFTTRRCATNMLSARKHFKFCSEATSACKKKKNIVPSNALESSFDI